MRTRLIHCTGYYATVTAVSALKTHDVNSINDNNILLILNNKQDTDKQRQIAQQLYNFCDVYFYDDKKDNSIFKQISEKYPNIDEYWDNFIMPNVIKSIGKYRKKIIKYKDFYIYDEGTQTYLELISKDREFYNGKGIKEIYLLNTEIIDSNFKQSFPVPIRQINVEYFKHNINLISNLDIQDIKPNSVLFLSSRYTDDDINNLLISGNIKIINDVMSNLNINVYYARHPRDKFTKVEYLKSKIDKVDNFHVLEPTILSDILLLKYKENIKYILSYGTSTLLSSYRIYGIPAFTFTDKELLTVINKYEHYSYMLQYIFDTCIPNITKLLSSNKTPKEYYLEYESNRDLNQAYFGTKTRHEFLAQKKAQKKAKKIKRYLYIAGFMCLLSLLYFGFKLLV